MSTSNTRAGKFRSIVGRIVMAFVCASMMGGTFIAPALGEDHDRREGYKYKERGRSEHDRYKHRRRVHHPPPRYYPAPVYAPPPVVYYPDPYQSPGISIVFPIHIR